MRQRTKVLTGDSNEIKEHFNWLPAASCFLRVSRFCLYLFSSHLIETNIRLGLQPVYSPFSTLYIRKNKKRSFTVSHCLVNRIHDKTALQTDLFLIISPVQVFVTPPLVYLFQQIGIF